MLDRQIRIIPSFTGYREGVICFETHCGPEEVRDLSKFAFEHHGEAYSPFDPGSLRLFHERILLGQAMPSTLVLTEWYRYDQIMAATLFTQPLLILEAECTSLVNSFDLLDRLGPPAFGHIPHDHKELAYLIQYLTAEVREGQVRSENIQETLKQCTQMISHYILEGSLPPSNMPEPKYQIHMEKESFIAFSSEDYVWDEMWRKGYLWGIWAKKDTCELRRKSTLVSGVDLDKLLKTLSSVFEEGNWFRKDSNTLEGQATVSQIITTIF